MSAAVLPVRKSDRDRPSHWRGTLSPKASQDRRHQVDMLGERRHATAPRARRLTDQQRDVERLREEARLAEHPVVAQHLAMVRR